MIDYLVRDAAGEERRFTLSWRMLQEQHARLCDLADHDFLRELPAALHFACIISWLKELPRDATLGDYGIVHELVHLLHEGTTTPLSEIRRQFAEVLRP